MPIWPATLPQSFPIGTTETVQDVRIRTQMDSGLTKMRRRFTAAVRTYTLPAERFMLTDTQAATLEDFYRDELKGGSLPFTWETPWPTAGTRTFRFVSPLNFTNILPGAADRLVSSALILEEVP